MINLEKLYKAGVHFGHQKRRWCPKMAPYIWGFKNNVHLIDISKTAIQLEKAAKFLEEKVGQGASILWVGTKKPAQDIVKSVALSLDMPFVNHRWIGGTLSNFGQVKKSATKFLHYKDVIDKADKYPHYTKKELNVVTKAASRLEKNVGGILNLKWPVGVLVIVDVIKERSALREAASMGIPVIALVDTNADPSLVDFVIPTNDDSPRAIHVILDYLTEAAKRGHEVVAQKKEQERIARENEKAEKAAAAKNAAAERAKKETAPVEAPAPKAKIEKTEKPVEKAAKPEKTVTPEKPAAKAKAEKSVEAEKPKKTK